MRKYEESEKVQKSNGFSILINKFSQTYKLYTDYMCIDSLQKTTLNDHVRTL